MCIRDRATLSPSQTGRGFCGTYGRMANEVSLNNDYPRYEIRVGGELAGFADFIERDGVRTFNHTEVFPEFQGQGLSGELIQYALDDTHDEGKQVVPQCSAVAHFMDKHSGYKKLLAQ